MCQSVACLPLWGTGESRRGHFLFNDFEPPGKGAGVSRLRVCPFGVQANHAGYPLYYYTYKSRAQSKQTLAIIKEFVTASP